MSLYSVVQLRSIENLFRHLFCLVFLLLPVLHEYDCRDSRSPAGTERTSVTTLSPVPRQVRNHFIHPSQQYMFLSCSLSPFHAFNTCCINCCLCASSQRQLEKDLAVIAAESEKEGERGAMVSSLRLNLWFIAALGP